MDILLIRPRGFCAGVDRAIATVDAALEKFGTPLYVRHEIVHNRTVVEGFKARGVVFIDSLADAPEGAVVVFSAHGVSQQVRTEANSRKQLAIDATCPLVTKVHMEAARYARQGYHLLLIGHTGHVEVLGTMGQVPPESITLVTSQAEAETVNVPTPDKVALLTQTTLSVDDTAAMIDILKQRFPLLQTPRQDDICYATQNRQAAVKLAAPQCDVMLVVGSPSSSNSTRLVEVALQAGCPKAYLIENVTALRPEYIQGATRIGVTAGASAPEPDVQAIVTALEPTTVEELDGPHEDMRFGLPAEVRIRIKTAAP